jgi:hypothetical protein
MIPEGREVAVEFAGDRHGEILEVAMLGSRNDRVARRLEEIPDACCVPPGRIQMLDYLETDDQGKCAEGLVERFISRADSQVEIRIRPLGMLEALGRWIDAGNAVASGGEPLGDGSVAAAEVESTFFGELERFEFAFQRREEILMGAVAVFGPVFVAGNIVG